MRSTKAKAIRRVLNLSRHPKGMSTQDRSFYRAVKRAYISTPAPQRAAYLDMASKIRQVIQDRMTKNLQGRGNRGLSRLYPTPLNPLMTKPTLL